MSLTNIFWYLRTVHKCFMEQFFVLAMFVSLYRTAPRLYSQYYCLLIKFLTIFSVIVLVYCVYKMNRIVGRMHAFNMQILTVNHAISDTVGSPADCLKYVSVDCMNIASPHKTLIP